MTMSDIIKNHYKSPFPKINVHHWYKPVVTDPTYYYTQTIDDGSTCTRLFYGTKLLFLYVYDMKTYK